MIMQVSPWQLWAYCAMVLVVAGLIAWTAYKNGYKRGYFNGSEDTEHAYRNLAKVVPRAFVQRRPTDETGRVARVGRGRIVPRKQTFPTEPRREKPKDTQELSIPAEG